MSSCSQETIYMSSGTWDRYRDDLREHWSRHGCGWTRSKTFMVTQTQAGVRQKELPFITNAVCLTNPQSGHNNAFLLGSSEPVLKRWSSHIISFLLFPVQMECLTPRSSSKMLKVLALTVTRREAQENVYRLPNRSQGRPCNKVHENSPILCSSIIEKHSSTFITTGWWPHTPEKPSRRLHFLFWQSCFGILHSFL